MVWSNMIMVKTVLNITLGYAVGDIVRVTFVVSITTAKYTVLLDANFKLLAISGDRGPLPVRW